jgi:glycosyltransferase involved in cell wall biosynthesis
MKNYKLIVFIETWNKTYNNKNIGKLVKRIGNKDVLIAHEDQQLKMCNSRHIRNIVTGSFYEVLLQTKQLIEILKSIKNGYIISYSGYNVNFILILLKNIFSFKVIIKNDSQVLKKSRNLRSLIKNITKKWIIKNCDILISETDVVYRHYIPYRGDRKHLLWCNGVDLQSSYFTGKKLQYHLGDYILFSGRLSWLKGIDKAVEMYLSSAVDIKLMIVGLDMCDGSVKYAKKMIKLSEKSDLISWCDTVDIPELYDIYYNARFSIITSKDEGLPNRMTESIALGTPVLSYDVGRVKELLNERLGTIVRNDDEFVKRLEMWCKDDVLIDLMSKNCIEYRDKNLDESKILSKLEIEIK